MNPMEISVTLRAFIAKFVRARQFGDSENIFESGYVNSLFVMQLILFIEKEFALAVANEDLELANFSSVDAMTAFVLRKRDGACLAA